MKPENFAERKQLLRRFVILYVVSIALLVLAFALFSSRQSPASVSTESEVSIGQLNSVEARYERAGSLLGGYTGRLLELDERYTRLLTDSAIRPSGVEDANREVKTQEYALVRVLDSLDRQGREFGPMVTSFRSLLAGHRALTRLQTSLAGITMPYDDDQLTAADKQAGDKGKLGALHELQGIRAELKVKDEMITELQTRLDRMPGDGRSSSADGQTIVRLRNDNSVLQQRLDEQEKTATLLREQIVALRHAGETTRSMTNDPDRSADGQNTWASRNAALERRTTELADELRFAQVDCNLSRADARQVVYNQKQRKDLLTDALTTLNDLAKSQDADVQRKAKEKIAQLRNIASTVHD